MEKKREQLVVDVEKCTGCGRCMVACSMKHHDMINPSLSRIRVISFKEQGFHVPLICMACNKAPCIKVCPMNARVRLANGSVVTDTEVCIGCRACVYICPVSCPLPNPYTGQTITCDMCTDDPSGPWCVTACKEEGALSLAKGDLLAVDTQRDRAAKIREIYPSR